MDQTLLSLQTEGITSSYRDKTDELEMNRDGEFKVVVSMTDYLNASTSLQTS